MRNLVILGVFFIIIPTLIFSQTETNVTKVGTTSAPFLKIEPGARSVGMGGAFVAVANDATSIYSNPAGIARLSGIESILIHTEWLAGLNYDFVGLVLPLGTIGTLGVSITSLSMSEQKVRTVFYPEGTGEKYGAGDMAVGLSYARNLTDRFSIGLNCKYINQNIWHMSSSSFAVDIGTLFTTQFNGMKIGMSISNFGSNMQLDGKDTSIKHDPDPTKYGNNDRIPAYIQTDKYSLPLIFRVGLAMDVIKSKCNRMTMAIDAVHPNDNTEHLNLGVEYDFNNMIFLRTGYKNLFTKDSEEGLTAGAGIKYRVANNTMLKIDYAYQNFGRLLNAQRFSIGLEF